MSDRDSTGAGFSLAFAVMFVLAVFFLLGMLTAFQWAKGDCLDYGKVQLRFAWFECKPLPEKK